MKLYCKGPYHNNPAGLHFDESAIQVDDHVAEFLLRDAPDNFEIVAEAEIPTSELTPHIAALDEPPLDKQVKAQKGRVRKCHW